MELSRLITTYYNWPFSAATPPGNGGLYGATANFAWKVEVAPETVRLTPIPVPEAPVPVNFLEITRHLVDSGL